MIDHGVCPSCGCDDQDLVFDVREQRWLCERCAVGDPEHVDEDEAW